VAGSFHPGHSVEVTVLFFSVLSALDALDALDG
jgi:hypothetical protein